MLEVVKCMIQAILGPAKTQAEICDRRFRVCDQFLIDESRVCPSIKESRASVGLGKLSAFVMPIARVRHG